MPQKLKLQQWKVKQDGEFVDVSAIADNKDSVQDVKINGTSIVSDNVANIPVMGNAGSDNPSLVKVRYLNGISTDPSGYLYPYCLKNYIDVRQVNGNGVSYNTTSPVTLALLDYAVKAAMCDGKGTAWTEDEQKAAQQRLGILSVEEVLF